MKRENSAGGMKGSLAVEASLVLSFTMVLLGAMIFCTFYIHDRAALQAMVCEIASAGSNGLTAKERQQTADRLGRGITEERFLGSRGLGGTAQAGEEKAEASWSGSFPVPGLAMKFFSGNRLELSASWSSPASNPAREIRNIRGLADLVGEALG